MKDSDGPIPLEPPADARPTPPLNVLELAAKQGFGPLSPRGQRVWHGEGRPCVSCGHLVHRMAKTCPDCGQDLSDGMLEKMRSHAGPWYVHEHVRPFPGVSLERLIRQIRRGVLTRTTVVRGPTTHHQWRFAAETPMLSKYLGCCWVCQSAVRPNDPVCGACGVDLDGGFAPDGSAPRKGAAPAEAELAHLTSALGSLPGSQRVPGQEAAPRLGRLPASWLIGILAVATLAAVVATVQLRTRTVPPARSVPTDVTAAPAGVAQLPSTQPAGQREAGVTP